MTEYKMSKKEKAQEKINKAVDDLMDFLKSEDEYKKTDRPLFDIFARNLSLHTTETGHNTDGANVLTHYKIVFDPTDFGEMYPDLLKKFNRFMKKITHFTTKDKLLPTFVEYNFFTYC
jgi:hypothetical protein